MKKRYILSISLLLFSSILWQTSAQDVTYTVTPITTTENGSIELEVNAGTAPFEFSWEYPDGSTSTEEDLYDLISLGSYCVTITDANCCTADGCFDLYDCDGLSIQTIITEEHSNASTTSSNDVQINITIDGISDGNYTYQWSNGETTEDLNNLYIGIYCVTITNACGKAHKQICITITSCDMNISVVKSPTCNGVPEGAISVSVSGNSPFSYAWSNGETSQNISNLYPGLYTVTVTDALSCSVVKNIPLKPTEPDYIINPAIDGTCSDDGSIDLTIFGGGLLIEYEWSNGATTQDIINLTAGTYTVTITNGQGCENIKNYTVPFTGINLGADITHSCTGEAVGFIGLGVYNSSGDFSIQWSNGATAQSIWYLMPGEYCVTVVDNVTQCNASECYTVETQQNEVFLTGSVVTNVCSGNELLGSIDIDVVFDGGAHESYQWSNGATTQDINDLNPGDYCVTISYFGCEQMECFEVLSINSEPINIDAEISPPCYYGNGNGMIDLIVSGGSEMYTYQWNNGVMTQDANNLDPGQYCVTVTTSQGCTATDCYVLYIAAPGLFASTIPSCGNENSGSIDLTPISPLYSPVTVIWSTGETTEDINGLDIGTYAVTVIDNTSGCDFTNSFVVSNGLTTQSSTDPCGIETRCNGVSVDDAFVPSPLDCNHFENPLDCTLFTCYCTLTDEVNSTDNAEYLSFTTVFSTCTYLGLCPSGSGQLEVVTIGSPATMITTTPTETCAPCATCSIVSGCMFTVDGLPLFVPNPSIPPTSGVVVATRKGEAGENGCSSGECPYQVTCNGTIVDEEFCGFCQAEPPSVPVPMNKPYDEYSVQSIFLNAVKNGYLDEDVKLALPTGVKADITLKEYRNIYGGKDSVKCSIVDAVDAKEIDKSELDQLNSLNNRHNKDLVVIVKPNPFSNKSAIQFYTEENEKWSIQVTNLVGKVIFQKEHITIVGENVIELFGEELVKEGIYLLTLYNQNKTIVSTHKIVYLKN